MAELGQHDNVFSCNYCERLDHNHCKQRMHYAIRKINSHNEENKSKEVEFKFHFVTGTVLILLGIKLMREFYSLIDAL